MTFLLTNLLATGNVVSQTRERSEVPLKHQWDLSHLYENDATWEAAKTDLAQRMQQITRYKGQLESSAKTLLECMKFTDELGQVFDRLGSYAGMKSDEDTRVSKYMGMRQEVGQMGTDFAALAAFMEPELVAMDKETFDRFIKEEPGLEIYRHYFDDLQRRKAHKLSEKEETIIAHAGLMSGGAYNIFSVFSNAEMPYPEATLEDGTVVKLDKAGYGRYRAAANRSDREKVFETFFGALGQFKGTYGAQLNAQIKSDVFYSRVRGYESALHSALDVNNIPVEVYHSLIKGVNDNLDTFHRYLKLRQRMLGMDQLKYSDIYAPTVKGVELSYDIEESWNLIVDALKPLGKAYVDVVERSRENRWIDVYPTPGKRAGAYSNDGAYDAHPYMLLNYNGQYNDVSTMAHELGHTMHTYLSNKNQPYPLAGYSIFVAEVASTFNEALLMDKMLKEIDDDNVRLSLLMEYLDGIKGTLFRQTQFAEFEWRIHQKAEAGVPLTGDVLTEIYADILKTYYGHDEGVCLIDDVHTLEWAYIPHFYYDYYVYQYATSFTASTALAEMVLKGEKGARDRFLAFLSAGGSDYPINILKEAGVDMTTSEPFDMTIQRMNRVMDEIEAILDKK